MDSAVRNYSATELFATEQSEMYYRETREIEKRGVARIPQGRWIVNRRNNHKGNYIHEAAEQKTKKCRCRVESKFWYGPLLSKSENLNGPLCVDYYNLVPENARDEKKFWISETIFHQAKQENRPYREGPVDII